MHWLDDLPDLTSKNATLSMDFPREADTGAMRPWSMVAG